MVAAVEDQDLRVVDMATWQHVRQFVGLLFDMLMSCAGTDVCPAVCPPLSGSGRGKQSVVFNSRKNFTEEFLNNLEEFLWTGRSAASE